MPTICNSLIFCLIRYPTDYENSFIARLDHKIHTCPSASVKCSPVKNSRNFVPWWNVPTQVELDYIFLLLAHKYHFENDEKFPRWLVKFALRWSKWVENLHIMNPNEPKKVLQSHEFKTSVFRIWDKNQPAESFQMLKLKVPFPFGFPFRHSHVLSHPLDFHLLFRHSSPIR